MHCKIAKPAIGLVESSVKAAKCADNGDCTVTFDGLSPVTDYLVYCFLYETIGSFWQPFSNVTPYKLSMPAPTAAVAVKTQTGAQFDGDVTFSEVTYSSAKVTAKIDKENKKLECFPVKGAAAAAPTNWEAQRVIFEKEVPIKVAASCGAANSACTVYLSYLEAGSDYTVWCRPEGVDSSKKKVEFKTDAALVAGEDTLTYVVTITTTDTVTVDQFNGNAALKTQIATALAATLKLPATSTVTVSATGTATSKYTIQASNLKVEIKITKIDDDKHADIYQALVSAVKNGGLNAALQFAGATTASIDAASTVTNPQDNTPSPSGGGDDGDGDDDSDSAFSSTLSLMAMFLALLSFVAL
jgi:hypothetical protein